MADGVAVNDRVWRQQQQQGGRVVRQADDAAAAVAGPSSRAGGQPRGRLCSPAHLREVCSVNPSDADCKLQGAAQLLQRGADRVFVARGCAGLGSPAGGWAGGRHTSHQHSRSSQIRNATKQPGEMPGLQRKYLPRPGRSTQSTQLFASHDHLKNNSDVHVR